MKTEMLFFGLIATGAVLSLGSMAWVATRVPPTPATQEIGPPFRLTLLSLDSQKGKRKRRW